MAEEVDLDAIRARADAATEGPWLVDDVGCILTPYGGVISFDTKDEDCILGWTDSEFIAHARVDIPALLAFIDRLRASMAIKDKALEPFAKLGRAIDDPRSPDVKNGKHAKDESIFAGQVLYNPTEHNPITFGALRRAAQALHTTERKDG